LRYIGKEVTVMKIEINPVKYKRLARIFRVIMKIMFGVSIVGACLAAASGMILMFIPSAVFPIDIVNNGTISLTLEGIVRYKLEPGDISPAKLKPILNSILFAVAVSSATISPVFKQLASILKTVEEDRPFATENAKRLMVIGFTFIIGSFVIRAAEFFVIKVLIDTFRLQNLSLNYSADNNMMIMAFLMFILAGVFRYGSYLQQEFDSTV
jgi:formylmethanofuran dehydrogenase subunit D